MFSFSKVAIGAGIAAVAMLAPVSPASAATSVTTVDVASVQITDKGHGQHGGQGSWWHRPNCRRGTHAVWSWGRGWHCVRNHHWS